MRRFVATLGLAVAATVAHGHDTWFTPLPPNARGHWVLALGTGTAFPVYEVPVSARQLAHSGCVGEAVRERPLRDAGTEGATAPALLLRTGRPVSALAAASCWAQLVPIDIQIDDPTVEVYLDEIQALPAVRARWAELKARGVRWQETYVKHVRLEIDGEAGGAVPALPELGMDARLETARRPLRAGDSVRIQVLRDGRALAGLPVQLRSDRSPLGLWRTTDAEGRIEAILPLEGRWILRGTDLRPATDHPDRWESGFLTLGFEVKPKR